MSSSSPKKSTAKRGPLEVVDGKNIHIPLYDAGGGKVLLAYYAEGRRKLVKCRDRESARKRAKKLIDELAEGTAHVATFTAKQAAAVNTAVDILQPLDIGSFAPIKQSLSPEISFLPELMIGA